MSNPCQQCFSEYDVHECENCQQELCMDCSVMSFDYTHVCPSCVDDWNNEYRSRYTEMSSLLMIVYANVPHKMIGRAEVKRIQKVLGV